MSVLIISIVVFLIFLFWGGGGIAWNQTNETELLPVSVGTLVAGLLCAMGAGFVLRSPNTSSVIYILATVILIISVLGTAVIGGMEMKEVLPYGWLLLPTIVLSLMSYLGKSELKDKG
jgi:hypothetical protein